MMDRPRIEQLLAELYRARFSGELDPLCALFVADATFRIAGASVGKPIAMSARGADEIRTWLTLLVKSFRVLNPQYRLKVIDGHTAAVHWHADIHSRITGSVVPTELVDLIEFDERHIHSYVEFFVPS